MSGRKNLARNGDRLRFFAALRMTRGRLSMSGGEGLAITENRPRGDTRGL